MIDVEAEREQTPGCRDQAYLDSAGSSLPASRVAETMVVHLRREAEIGGYRAAAERREDLDGLRGSLGRLLGCAPDLIALTDSATRSWNKLVTAIRWRPGDRILICAMSTRATRSPCSSAPGSRDVRWKSSRTTPPVGSTWND
jgi:cysteine desulfurase